jgi:plastocyanin
VSLAARAGRPLLAAALLPLLAACGGTASSSSASAAGSSSASGPASSPASTASGCGTSLQITVKGSTVTPAPGTTDVKAGCQVDLTITADRTSEVHVHVVDLEKPITAGQPLHVTFTPTQTGVYEVELHDPDLLLVKLAVR